MLACGLLTSTCARTRPPTTFFKPAHAITPSLKKNRESYVSQGKIRLLIMPTMNKAVCETDIRDQGSSIQHPLSLTLALDLRGKVTLPAHAKVMTQCRPG